MKGMSAGFVLSLFLAALGNSHLDFGKDTPGLVLQYQYSHFGLRCSSFGLFLDYIF